MTHSGFSVPRLRTVCWGVWGLCVLGAAQGQICNDNIQRTRPDSRYEALADASPANSEVRDRATGLIWQRCVVGMAWNGSTCTGAPTALNWTAALDAAGSATATNSARTPSPWRVPSFAELYSLVERACNSPSINTTWFPATPFNPLGATHTATPYAPNVLQLVGIDFTSGNDYPDNKTSARRVRLVRTGLPDNCSSFDSCSRNTGVR